MEPWYLKLYPKIKSEIFKILSNPKNFNSPELEVNRHYELFHSLIKFSIDSDDISNGTYINSIISFVYERDHSEPKPLSWALVAKLKPEASKELFASMEIIKEMNKLNIHFENSSYTLSKSRSQFPNRNPLCSADRKGAGLTAKEWSEHLEMK